MKQTNHYLFYCWTKENNLATSKIRQISKQLVMLANPLLHYMSSALSILRFFSCKQS